jgi:hypothetical protein
MTSDVLSSEFYAHFPLIVIPKNPSKFLSWPLYRHYFLISLRKELLFKNVRDVYDLFTPYELYRWSLFILTKWLIFVKFVKVRCLE